VIWHYNTQRSGDQSLQKIKIICRHSTDLLAPRHKHSDCRPIMKGPPIKQ